MHLGFPHEPEFENVHSAAALNVFVAGVKGWVVEFILLEEIRCIAAVAGFEEALVPHQEGRALLRHRQQLVWIPSHRVSSNRNAEEINIIS